MAQSNMFNTLFYNFETNQNENNVIKLPISDAHFGILNFNTVSSDITKNTKEFIFVIDQSGSMSDSCSDGRSKMHHITHTLKNMILYFYDNKIQSLYVTVFAFDSNFVSVIEKTQINDTNLQEILTKIDGIRPKTTTNIEQALKKTGEYISQVKTNNPLHNIYHIFMTDGEATHGSNDYTVLNKLIDTDIENIFIGFGTGHDSLMLNNISGHINSSYHFIDELEKAGLVYGEILHGILYRYLTNVEVTLDNGMIYDFKNNQWVSKLFIGNISGEAEKTYHLISNTPDSCNIILHFTKSNEKYLFAVCELINPQSNHMQYIYRQKTLELLFEVDNLQKNKLRSQQLYMYKCFSIYETKCETDTNLNSNKEYELKEKLSTFLKEIKKYMSDNNLTDDCFLKNLCDDIYISYRTLGTVYGAMYNSARQISQGNQRCYAVSNTPKDYDDESQLLRSFDNISSKPVLSRQINSLHSLNLFNPDDTRILKLLHPDDLLHNCSNYNESPYKIPTANRLMRDISINSTRFEPDLLLTINEETPTI